MIPACRQRRRAKQRPSTWSAPRSARSIALLGVSTLACGAQPATPPSRSDRPAARQSVFDSECTDAPQGPRREWPPGVVRDTLRFHERAPLRLRPRFPLRSHHPKTPAGTRLTRNGDDFRAEGGGDDWQHDISPPGASRPIGSRYPVGRTRNAFERGAKIGEVLIGSLAFFSRHGPAAIA
jgi:hypothetical protein